MSSYQLLNLSKPHAIPASGALAPRILRSKRGDPLQKQLIQQSSASRAAGGDSRVEHGAQMDRPGSGHSAAVPGSNMDLLAQLLAGQQPNGAPSRGHTPPPGIPSPLHRPIVQDDQQVGPTQPHLQQQVTTQRDVPGSPQPSAGRHQMPGELNPMGSPAGEPRPNSAQPSAAQPQASFRVPEPVIAEAHHRLQADQMTPSAQVNGGQLPQQHPPASMSLLQLLQQGNMQQNPQRHLFQSAQAQGRQQHANSVDQQFQPQQSPPASVDAHVSSGGHIPAGRLDDQGQQDLLSLWQNLQQQYAK
ncbi:hypothetical protein WJX84_007654 [Apatococcus fuscideae]|uniref:Uncharacterized protein n=1 Tax=Apatococcus fuscideae TaxID=2026836 RepID=A0AAW1TFV4_9CHLO